MCTLPFVQGPCTPCVLYLNVDKTIVFISVKAVSQALIYPN